jgi:hypothetical protein
MTVMWGCNGIRGVIRGDARTIVEEAGAMARFMVGEQTNVVLLDGKAGVSDEVAETVALGSKISWLEGRESEEGTASTRRVRCRRISSLIKPENKFLNTHLPRFTVKTSTKSNRRRNGHTHISSLR